MKEEKAVFEAYLAEHDLQKLLKVPYRCPFPDCSDREEWARVADEDRRAILEAASEAKKKPYPVLLATDYMAFARSGNRKVFEDPYFFRRKKLILSTLAYCLEEKDEDLDEVINGLWCIMEETSWVISAHNVDSHAGALGSVHAVDDSTPNILFLVRDGERERIIPANAEWITEVDRKNRTLMYNLPEGLAEL